MKKKEKGQKSVKRAVRSDADLGDFGLEPPKRYREAPERSTLEKRKKSRFSQKAEPEVSRNEKRTRETKKRKKRNRLRKFLIWFAVAVLLAAIGIVLSLTVFFKIESITVKGNERYSADEVLMQCAVNKGENLFTADIDTAEEMIEKNLPYIYIADIHRKFPSELEIKLTEATPYYHIKKDKKYILLDDRLKVLELEAEKPQGITISKAEIKSATAGLQIEFNDAAVGDCLKQLSQVIRENELSEITAIYSNAENDNYAVYNGRIELRLGSCTDLENKIFQGMAACEKLNETSPNAEGVMTVNGGKQIYFTEKN